MEVSKVLSTTGEPSKNLTIQLPNNEGRVIAEGQKLLFLRGDISSKTYDVTSDKPLVRSLYLEAEKALTKTNLFLSEFTGKGDISFRGNIPGVFISVPLKDGTLMLSKESFVASTGDFLFKVINQHGVGSVLFGSMGLIHKEVKGTGTVYLYANGYEEIIELKKGDEITVQAGCVVAWEDSVTIELTTNHDIKSVISGGEALVLNKFTGPGRVILQTVSIHDLQNLIGNSICIAPPPIMMAEFIVNEVKKILSRILPGFILPNLNI